MKHSIQAVLGTFLLTIPASSAETTGASQSKKALQGFNQLIGTWKGTGEPEGTRAEKRKGFWIETIAWEWQFSKTDPYLSMELKNGKHWSKGELRYLPDAKEYQLKLTTPEKKSVTFTGKATKRQLTVHREDKATKEIHQLVFTFLHSNRYLYRYEVKREGRSRFKKVYQVGATKKGVPFATSGSTAPECVVSGGKGTIAVMHQGKTWYVCCRGCKSEFEDNPDKYIKEYLAKKAKEKK